MKKYFTLAEANALLPQIENELEKIQAIKKSFERKYKEHEAVSQQDVQNEQKQFTLECEMEFLQIEAKTHINNIEQTGAELKNIEIGLIDFLSLKDGNVVLLCWKQGESSISHYHGVHEGFAGRKPI